MRPQRVILFDSGRLPPGIRLRALDVVDELTMREVTIVNLSAPKIEETNASLRAYGQRGLEGFVLWLGQINGNRATVTNCYVPPQNSIRSEDGVGYFISSTTLFELNHALSRTGLRMIAQVHSHPGRAYHSAMDDRYAVVTTDGGLSLVVPNFGRGIADLMTWAVYRLKTKTWERLNAGEVSSLFQLTAEPGERTRRRDFLA